MPDATKKRSDPRPRLVTLALPTGNADHDSPATPPKEFCVFAAGTNPSEKGDFLFDEEAAKLVMEHAKRWGNRFPLDWCHKMVRMDGPDPAEDGKASGWFTPELRNGELWATAITWTPLARQKIGDREFVYFSPAFNVDDEERVVELTNVALTNLPAMHSLEQLVAADAKHTSNEPAPRGSRHSRRVTMTKDELKDAIHGLHAKVHGEMYDEGMKSAMDAKLDEMKMDELKAHHAKLAKMCGDAGEPDGDEPHKEPDGDEADKKADEKKDKADGDSEPPPPPSKETSRGASDAVLLGRVVQLENELAKVKSEKVAEKRSVILDAAAKDSKLTPADLQGETDRGKFIRTLSNEQLATYVRTLSKAASNEEIQQGERPARDGRTFSVELEKGRKISVTLSREDIEVARSLGTDLEAFAKTRAREAESIRRFRADGAEHGEN